MKSASIRNKITVNTRFQPFFPMFRNMPRHFSGLPGTSRKCRSDSWIASTLLKLILKAVSLYFIRIKYVPLPYLSKIGFSREGGIFFHKKWPPLERSGEALQEQNRTPAVKDSPMGINKTIGRKIVLLLPVEEQAQETERSP